MVVFKEKKDLIQHLENEYTVSKNVGLVPTMGALHDGHLELIRNALNDNCTVVCSIFVNPTQFSNQEDLDKYPRTINEDLQKLEVSGCHIVYTPDNKDLYNDPDNINTTIHFGAIETDLEGKYRPGHFRGVGLVVAKLFNIIKPHTAYFGQKDLQQFFVIKQLIEDLSYPIRLVQIPTVRESDGLAISSRNRRINPNSRLEANKFYECLVKSRDKLRKGESIPQIKLFAREFLTHYSHLKLDYFEVIDTRGFRIIDSVESEKNTALCIAGYIDNIRLIDNVTYN